MAYFERRGDRWRVQIRRRGVIESRTFRTKAQGREWALQVEAGITGDKVSLSKHTVLEALRRYAREVSPDKRGARWEKLRLNAMEDDSLAKRQIATVAEDHVADWRDRRRKHVGPATVRREMNLLSSVFEIARGEWKWVRANPFRGVKKPLEPPARRRGVTADEFTRLAAKLTGPAGKEVALGFELGIESGMRAGEMWGLERPQIDLKSRVAHLEQTKNGDKRDVALSLRAVEIIRELLADGRPVLFTCSSATRDALFRKARNAAEIPDIHFHDSRSEAVSRLSKRLNVLELAEQIGHRDLNSLQSYYRQPASERAKRLDGPQTTGSLPKPPTEA